MEFEIRRADVSDADDIAVAHRDSIHSIGPSFYPPDVVEAWAEGLVGDVYVNAMKRGEVFFIAVGNVDGKTAVVGFSSYYSIAGSRHGTSVYVRGVATRQGIGSALFREAEDHAAANGATRIEIESSLAGVQFYKRQGFDEIGTGETTLMSGRRIECVFMKKTISTKTIYTIRDAVSADIDTLVAFTLREAYEAEGLERNEADIRRGVQGGFGNPPLAAYWVAETPDHGIAGSVSVVTEWSNFYGGQYWWIQSIFILPEHRGSGLVELLLNHVAKAAETAGALDLRLYAHNSNERALRVYRRCGFKVAPYVMMSRLKRAD